MANYNLAKQYTKTAEGGYVNDPNDAGEETYQGLSRKFYPKWDGWDFLDAQPHPIAHNTIFPELNDSVDAFYKVIKWDDINADDITSQKMATYIYDWHVTSGGAIKEVQKALSVEADGNFGNNSVSALNDFDDDFLETLRSIRVGYYIGLHNSKYEKGWVSRANNLYLELKNLNA